MKNMKIAAFNSNSGGGGGGGGGGGAVNITAHAVSDHTNVVKENATNKEQPPPPSLSPFDFVAVDGLRVLACACVMAFHALLYWGALLDVNKGIEVNTQFDAMRASPPPPQITSMTTHLRPPRSPAQLLDGHYLLRLTHFGSFGVDIFLVLTGFWATWQLLPHLEAAKNANAIWPLIKDYYKYVYYRA